ncbi:hypothetical protein ACIBP6_04340 [Nonomuraea terrae]|uniref:hypothetical protein n=1 Tax=Nonomuraea terrae TaxID=2530383 RepID=UPI0037B7EF44
MATRRHGIAARLSTTCRLGRRGPSPQDASQLSSGLGEETPRSMAFVCCTPIVPSWPVAWSRAVPCETTKRSARMFRSRGPRTA